MAESVTKSYILYCGGVLKHKEIGLNDEVVVYNTLSAINSSITETYPLNVKKYLSGHSYNLTDGEAFVYDVTEEDGGKITTKLRVIHSKCTPKMTCQYTQRTDKLFNDGKNIWSEEYFVDNGNETIFTLFAQHKNYPKTNGSNRNGDLPKIPPSWFNGNDIKIRYSFVNEDGTNDIPSATTVSMFSGCTKLLSCEIPGQMRKISDNTFKGCTSLISYTKTPEFIQEIGVSAFSGCSSLQTIEIGQNCSISERSFEGCSNADTIQFDGINKMGWGRKDMKTIPNYAFNNCSNLSSSSYYYTDYTNYPPSSSTYSSSDGAFLIPNCVETIGNHAFSNCKIQKISLGEDGVGGCSVETIGDYAFAGCSELTSVTIGSVVTSIGADAFKNSGIVELNFNANTINNTQGFNESTTLKRVTFGSNARLIDNNTFYQCFSLSSVTMGGVTTIGDNAFYECTSLSSFTVGHSVSRIGDGAFELCTNLKSINIPSNVTEIKDYAFHTCSSLSSVTFEARFSGTAHTLGSGLFTQCQNLSKITFNATTPPTIQTDTFDGTNSLIYVPNSVIGDYQSAWSNYSSRIVGIN